MILGAVVLGAIIAVAIIAGATGVQTYILTTNTSSLSIASGTGILAAQITDPLNLPSGVTDVYVSYSPIQVHPAGVALSSGWYTVANAASLDLSRFTAQSVTLGSAEVSTGVFTLANLSVTGATVTFQGKNYTATVVSTVITLPITNGGAVVQANSTSGFVIDFSPTIFKLQNTSGTGFSLYASAKSIAIPQHDWNPNFVKPGAAEIVNSTSWGSSISEEAAESSIGILSASLQNSSLTVVVKNTGNSEINVTSISLLSLGVSLGQYHPLHPFVSNTSSTTATSNSSSPTTNSTITTSINSTTTSTSASSASSSSATSNSTSTTTTTSSSISKIESGLEPVAQFTVLSNGTLVESNAAVSGDGFALQPGQSVTLDYHGSIKLLSVVSSGMPSLTVYSGQAYDFSVLADSGAVATFEYVVP